MPAKNLEALFLHGLKDIYFAEKQFLASMPALMKAAEAEELKHAFQTHRAETEGQIGRIERIFAIMGQEPEATPCEGALGIIKEGQTVLAEFGDGEACEAGIIAAAQAIEHYEIARYGTLRAWAMQLGLKEAADLLEQSLDEEADTDALLSEMAERGINQEAV